MSDLTAYAKGAIGENAAADYLTAQGMQLIEANYRVVGGEIDLILLDGNTLVFVEVKTRTHANRLEAESAITPVKKRRIQKAALQYLSERPQWISGLIRFDVVLLLSGQLVHIRDAFQGSEWF